MGGLRVVGRVLGATLVLSQQTDPLLQVEVRETRTVKINK